MRNAEEEKRKESAIAGKGSTADPAMASAWAEMLWSPDYFGQMLKRRSRDATMAGSKTGRKRKPI